MGPSGAVGWTLTASGLIGYRQNYTWWLGTWLRGGPFVGSAAYSTTTDEYETETRTAMLAGLMVEAVPFIGPFGRFYLGPVFWGRYLAFDENASDGRATVRDGWTGGVGFHFGVVLGRREQNVLSFAIYSSQMNPQTIFLAATIGFQPTAIARHEKAWPGSPGR